MTDIARWALVERGVVRDVTETDPSGRFHPAMPWVAGAPPGTAAGWSHVAGVFSPPPAAAPSPRPTVISSLSFLRRLTEAEDTAIHEAALKSAAVLRYLTRLGAATQVDLADPETVGGVDALIAAGLVAPGRRAELLAP